MNRLISPNLERIVADISRSIAREPRPRHDYPHVIPTRRGRVVTTQVIIGGISSVRHVASPYQLWRISLPNGEIRLSVPPGDSDYQILRAESTQERVFVCVCVCARVLVCGGGGDMAPPGSQLRSTPRPRMAKNQDTPQSLDTRNLYWSRR